MCMEAVRNTTPPDVWQSYREAFDEFARKVRHLQLLSARPGVAQSAIDGALLDLEQAHARYNLTRDALAEQYLPATALPLDTAGPHLNDVVLGWDASDDLGVDQDWHPEAELAGLVKPGCC